MNLQVDKVVNPVKNAFSINPSILYHVIPFQKNLCMSKISSTAIAS